jgi:hypothetical protein
MGVSGQRHAPATLTLGKRPGTLCTGDQGRSEKGKLINLDLQHFRLKNIEAMQIQISHRSMRLSY